MKSALTFLAAFVVATTAFAHSGATGVVKERMDMMKDLGATLKALATMTRSGEHDSELVRKSAQDIQRHAVHLPKMFPIGSDKIPSEAGAAIWQQQQRFKALFAKMGKAAELLEKSARHQGMTTAQIKVIQIYCRECHKDFRVKK